MASLPSHCVTRSYEQAIFLHALGVTVLLLHVIDCVVIDAGAIVSLNCRSYARIPHNQIRLPEITAQESVLGSPPYQFLNSNIFYFVLIGTTRVCGR
jgi:hypothetical protein